MSRFAIRIAAPLVALVMMSTAASALPLDFEDLTNDQLVGDHYTDSLGVTFLNASAVAAGGGSLIEEFFPLVDGSTVAILDLFGAITITFATPIDTFSGLFTYFLFDPSSRLTLTASDGSTAQSTFGNNVLEIGDEGSAPNELITLTAASAAGFSWITITGLPEGNSFTLDNVTYNPVPEPGTLALMLMSAVGLVSARRRLRAKR